MPYSIKKYKEGFRVCKKNNNNKCFSNNPLTLEIAKKQLKAIGINTHLKGGAIPLDKELYDKIKKDVYYKYPKHSLFRSALIVKKYINDGGKYKGEDNDMNIKKWFQQNWLSVNDYLRDEEIKCGVSDTNKKYGEYPLCRPKSILEKLSKSDMKKMINKKNELKEKHLITSKILNTDKYNIKSTITGSGNNNKFIEQLNKINLDPEIYLYVAREIAKIKGYDPLLLNFSNNNKNKLMYMSPEGLKHFGRIGYNDYIIYNFLEMNNLVKKGYSKIKQNVFIKSHSTITKKYNLNRYSPNELSINILW